MDDDRHPVIVRRTKDLAELRDVLRVVVVDDRVPEVQLEAVAKARILRAAGQLLERIVPERIEAAEASQPIREACHLLAGPVVLGLDLLVLVLDGSVRAPKRVRH